MYRTYDEIPEPVNQEFTGDKHTTVGDLKKFLKDIPDDSIVYLDTRPSSYEERKPDSKGEIKHRYQLMRAHWMTPPTPNSAMLQRALTGEEPKAWVTLSNFTSREKNDSKYHLFKHGRKISAYGPKSFYKEIFSIAALILAGIIALKLWPLTFIDIFSILHSGLIFLGCVILPPVIVNGYMKKLSEDWGLWVLFWTIPGILIGLQLGEASQQIVKALLTKFLLFL